MPLPSLRKANLSPLSSSFPRRRPSSDHVHLFICLRYRALTGAIECRCTCFTFLHKRDKCMSSFTSRKGLDWHAIYMKAQGVYKSPYSYERDTLKCCFGTMRICIRLGRLSALRDAQADDTQYGTTRAFQHKQSNNRKLKLDASVQRRRDNRETPSLGAAGPLCKALQ